MLLGNVKRISFLILAFIWVYLIYYLSILMLKFGFNGASGEFFFVTLGIYLIIPLIKYNKVRKDVLEGRFEYNRKVNNNLKKIKNGALPLDGVTVKHKGEVITLDNIVINRKGIFNIVKCDYKGNIIIGKNNKWFKYFRKGKEPIPCPVVTVRKNREALSSVIEEDAIIDVIVMVHDRVSVEGDELSDVPVVRYDELDDFIKNYDGEEKWDTTKLYDNLYNIIVSTKDLVKEKKIYEAFLDYKWLFRSRLTFISIFFVLYFLNLIYKYN